MCIQQNQALEADIDLCIIIHPISLDDIDDSNEQSVGISVLTCPTHKMI